MNTTLQIYIRWVNLKMLSGQESTDRGGGDDCGTCCHSNLNLSFRFGKVTIFFSGTFWSNLTFSPEIIFISKSLSETKWYFSFNSIVLINSTFGPFGLNTDSFHGFSNKVGCVFPMVISDFRMGQYWDDDNWKYALHLRNDRLICLKEFHFRWLQI